MRMFVALVNTRSANSLSFTWWPCRQAGQGDSARHASDAVTNPAVRLRIDGTPTLKRIRLEVVYTTSKEHFKKIVTGRLQRRHGVDRARRAALVLHRMD